jgi:hypothetical protein
VVQVHPFEETMGHGLGDADANIQPFFSHGQGNRTHERRANQGG